MLTYVKSATHSWLGRSASNWRFTRSPAAASFRLTVVRTFLPQRTPASPMTVIRRATVHLDTLMSSRSNCRQTLRTTYTLWFSSYTRCISGFSRSSHRVPPGALFFPQAVELRLRKIRGSLAQDIVASTQFTVLAFQLFQTLTFSGAQSAITTTVSRSY